MPPSRVPLGRGAIKSARAQSGAFPLGPSLQTCTSFDAVTGKLVSWKSAVVTQGVPHGPLSVRFAYPVVRRVAMVAGNTPVSFW